LALRPAGGAIAHVRVNNIHHNVFDSNVQRTPRVRFGLVPSTTTITT